MCDKDDDEDPADDCVDDEDQRGPGGDPRLTRAAAAWAATIEAHYLKNCPCPLSNPSPYGRHYVCPTWAESLDLSNLILVTGSVNPDLSNWICPTRLDPVDLRNLS